MIILTTEPYIGIIAPLSTIAVFIIAIVGFIYSWLVKRKSK